MKIKIKKTNPKTHKLIRKHKTIMTLIQTINSSSEVMMLTITRITTAYIGDRHVLL